MAKQRTTYSPSSIKLYLNCPRRYYFEYLDNYTSAYKNKQKIKQIRVEAGKRKELIFGGILHNILNCFLHLPEDERTKAKLLTFLKEIWTKEKGAREKEGGFPDIEEERKWYRQALDILERFHQTQDIFPAIAYLPEIENEGEFVSANFLKVPLRQASPNEPEAILGGKIDRIDKGKDGYHLIDYKTGRSERDDDFQLMAYTILAKEALGMSPTKASYLYLRSGNLKSFDPDKKAIERTKIKVLEIAEQIQKEEEFSPHPTKMCYYCDYLEFCSAKEEAKKIITEYKGKDGIADLPF